jgi:hypothetical protein|tara:strand:- start:276 stop:947 length:672 start_codon:yes stop_codon:yes gene_type:complete
MGFLDNSTITVDAILTKRGREILSQGGNFNITKFALSDEEVDYTLYDVTHPNGTDSYGAVIENMSLLEGAPNRTTFNSFLTNQSAAGASLEVAQLTYTGVNAGAPIPLSPTTKGGPVEDYSFTIENTNIVRFSGQGATKTFTGKSVELMAQSFGTPTPNASTLVTIQGVNSGLVSTINITVKTDTTGTGDAQGTQDPTTDANTGGDTTGGAGGQTYSGGKPNV